MKPLQIGLFVLVGALGGAVIMKFVQRPKTVPVPIVAAAPVSAPVQAEPVPLAPAVLPVVAAEPKPTAFAEKAQPVRPPHTRVTTVAQNRPVASPQPAIATPAPEPVQELPSPAVPSPAVPLTEPAPVAEAPPEPTEPQAPPAAPSVTLPAGTLFTVRLGESLSSEHNLAGDTFTASLDAPVAADGFVIAERGARVEGRVVEAQKASHVKGQGALVVELTRLSTSDGQRVPIQTEGFRKQTPKVSKEDVGVVAAVAGIGAVIGAIAGGGKGAAIGAGAGGAAGAGGVAATRGKAISLPSETRITFRLKEPVTITERVSH